MLSTTESALWLSFTKPSTWYSAGTELRYTAEYTKAEEMGSFLSRDLSVNNDSQECKHMSNSFPTHFIFQFSEIFLINLQTENSSTFSKT